MLSQGWSRWNAFQDEMCERGYAKGNPNKPAKVYRAVRKALTPLYKEMGQLIRSGDITYGNINKKACAKLASLDAKKYRVGNYRCKPQDL